MGESLETEEQRGEVGTWRGTLLMSMELSQLWLKSEVGPENKSGALTRVCFKD